MAQETINIDNNFKQFLLQKIDEQNYFCLGNDREMFPRRQFFNFLLGLGYLNRLKTTLKRKESFYRVENMRNEKSFYPAVYFTDEILKNKDKIDEILDEEKVYGVIEEYANTGFAVLKSYYENLNSESLMYTLINEIDEIYNQFIKDFPQKEE